MPLADVVLLPGTMIPLHIFEVRYARMVALCLDQDKPFGVALLQRGTEVGGPAVPYRVGTMATIRDHRVVAPERYLLLASGEERFTIHSYNFVDGLLVGQVSTLADEPSTVVLSAEQGERLSMLAVEHLRLLRQNVMIPFGAPNWLQDAERLSFALLGIVQAPAFLLQSLLELTDTRQRLDAVEGLLSHSNALLAKRQEVDAVASRICASNGRLDPELHLTRQLVRRAGG